MSWMESSTALSLPATVLCVARNQTPGVLSAPHALAHLLLCFSLASGLPSAPQGLGTCCPCCLEHSSPSAPLARLLLTIRASAQWCPPQQPQPKSSDHRGPPPLLLTGDRVLYPARHFLSEIAPLVALHVYFPPRPGNICPFHCYAQGLAYSGCSINRIRLSQLESMRSGQEAQET